MVWHDTTLSVLIIFIVFFVFFSFSKYYGCKLCFSYYTLHLYIIIQCIRILLAIDVYGVQIYYLSVAVQQLSICSIASPICSITNRVRSVHSVHCTPCGHCTMYTLYDEHEVHNVHYRVHQMCLYYMGSFLSFRNSKTINISNDY